MTNFLLILQIMAAIPLFINPGPGNKPVLTVSSNAFENNALIPSKYTCDGENISPQIKWSKGPEGTKTFVLICDDPDAPSKVWVHWLIFNIPPINHEIPENSAFIKGANYGTTDFGKTTYGGPCPPSGTHHYRFKIYALDSELKLNTGASKEAMEGAMKGHILAQGKLIGLYARRR
jgi:Raf kinase inhibitor-like YbhB/YbcL family protein